MAIKAHDTGQAICCMTLIDSIAILLEQLRQSLLLKLSRCKKRLRSSVAREATISEAGD
jgi:hypothetical protein